VRDGASGVLSIAEPLRPAGRRSRRRFARRRKR